MRAPRRLLLIVSVLTIVLGCSEREPSEAVLLGKHEPRPATQALSVADCPAGYRIVQGTPGPDRLFGSSGRDCILGDGGDDTIYGYGGNDLLVGGDGNDVVYGGGGNDSIVGDGGDDALYGESGADTLEAGDGDDLVHGGGGNDQLFGGAGLDRLNGGDGDDVVHGGDDADTLHGNGGSDTLHGDAGDDVLDGDGHSDELWGGAGDDALYGDASNDSLFGEEGDDALLGGSGTNVIDGGPGTDACSGTGCEKAALRLSGCTTDAQCVGDARCIVDFGVCLGCVSDQDGDAACDSKDACPTDAAKTSAGVCGCGVSDVDGDGDGSADCVDACASDASKVAPGACGCGVSDVDSDGDGSADCVDGCASDADKLAPGACGCGVSDADTDADGRADCVDLCAGYDDGIDQNGNGVPDGCDIPVGCTADTVGRGVYRGTFVIDATNLDQLAGITCITGSLHIGSNDIASLAPLSSLTAVVGDLVIEYASSLVTLGGLDALTHVGGDLHIDANDALTSLVGLDALQEVGGRLWISSNRGLTSLEGLEQLRRVGSLDVYGNEQLRDILTLLGLTNVGASPSEPAFYVSDNAVLPACQVWAVAARVGRTCTQEPYWDANGQYQNTDQCTNNGGTGSCGTLPEGFECAPGAQGPGVWDGDLVLEDERAPPMAGLTCVTGDVLIEHSYVAELSGLSSLQRIGGDLRIVAARQLTSLSGLDALTEVGGALVLSDNQVLADFSALDRLTRIGTRLDASRSPVEIHWNETLSPCQAWAIAGRAGESCVRGTLDTAWTHHCTHNTGTATCPRLPDSFACVPGAVGPGVYDGEVPSWQPLELWEGVRCITSQLTIEVDHPIDTWRDLQHVGGDLVIRFNEQLTNVDALSELTSVGGTLRIEYNPQLQSLAGLSKLARLGERLPANISPLVIDGNDSLPACWVWTVEEQTGASCRVMYVDGPACENQGDGSCGTLPPDFACVPGATGPGVIDADVELLGGMEETFAFTGATCITGNVTLEGYASTIPLRSLQKIGGDLRIQLTWELTDVHGLAALTEVGGQLWINENERLQSLAGLSSLTQVGTRLGELDPTLWIGFNASLPACWVAAVEQQTGERCGGEAGCWANDGAGSCEP